MDVLSYRRTGLRTYRLGCLVTFCLTLVSNDGFSCLLTYRLTYPFIYFEKDSCSAASYFKNAGIPRESRRIVVKCYGNITAL